MHIDLTAFDTKNNYIYIYDMNILMKYLLNKDIIVMKIELYYEIIELLFNNVFVTKLIAQSDFNEHKTIKLDSKIDIVYEVVYKDLRT